MFDLDKTWRDLCDNLRELGPEVVSKDLPEVDRAEGYRFLLRQLRIGIEALLENADPGHPLFHHGTGPDKKILIDNPDTDYLVAPVDPKYTYRITGNIGTSCYVGFAVYAGGGFGGLDVISNRNDGELEIGPNGEIELIVSESPHDGNWLPLAPGAMSLLVRRYFFDISSDPGSTFKIEVINPVEDLPALSADEVARRLHRVSTLTTNLGELTARYTNALSQVPNQLLAVSRKEADAGMGTPDNAYVVGYFDLEPDKALVVEGTPPDARYWMLYVMNRWSESFTTELVHDTCLNASQVTLEPDGSFKIVIAHQRPDGVVNWLSTGGRSDGWMALRWLCAQSEVPLPTCRLASVDEL